MLKARGTEYLLTEQGRVAFWPCYNMVVSWTRFSVRLRELD
jgi:hypothetical protein